MENTFSSYDMHESPPHYRSGDEEQVETERQQDQMNLVAVISLKLGKLIRDPEFQEMWARTYEPMTGLSAEQAVEATQLDLESSRMIETYAWDRGRLDAKRINLLNNSNE